VIYRELSRCLLLKAAERSFFGAGEGGRLIYLSSSGHRYSNDLEDPNFERTPCEPFAAYGRSNTANILFPVALTARTFFGFISNCKCEQAGGKK